MYKFHEIFVYFSSFCWLEWIDAKCFGIDVHFAMQVLGHVQSRLLQLDEEQNDNDRLMWLKTFNGENLRTKIWSEQSPLTIVPSLFIVVFYFIIILWLEITTAVTQAYYIALTLRTCASQWKKKTKQKTSNVPWMGGCFCTSLHASRAIFGHMRAFTWTATSTLNYLTRKNAVTAIWFRQSLLRIHLARSQDGCCLFSFSFDFRPFGAHGRWSMVGHKWRIIAMRRYIAVRRFGVAALACALAKKKVLTLLVNLIVITLVRSVNEMWLLPFFIFFFFLLFLSVYLFWLSNGATTICLNLTYENMCKR